MEIIITLECDQLLIRIDKLYKGSLILKDLDQPACYVLSFEIEEKNKGYGSFLLDAAIGIAKQNNCEALSLHCSISNHNALRFYKRKGMFIVATTTKKMYDAFVDKKEKHYLLTIKI